MHFKSNFLVYKWINKSHLKIKYRIPQKDSQKGIKAWYASPSYFHYGVRLYTVTSIEVILNFKCYNRLRNNRSLKPLIKTIINSICGKSHYNDQTTQTPSSYTSMWVITKGIYTLQFCSKWNRLKHLFIFKSNKTLLKDSTKMWHIRTNQHSFLKCKIN